MNWKSWIRLAGWLPAVAGGLAAHLVLAQQQEIKKAEVVPAAKTAVETSPAAPVENPAPGIEEDEKAALDRSLNFDLSPEQVARFKKVLPNTYRKLSLRKPFHIVALGDSVVDMMGYDDDAQNWIKGYPARFAEHLARQFFYTGGVRVIKPAKGREDKSMPHRGKEITLRSLGRGGKLSIHAMQALSTYGMEVPPDLVMVSFGINDATTGLDLGVYAKAFQDLIATVRAAGGEVVLLGPTLTVSDPPEVDMAKTRAYADTLREVAEDSGAFFVDLGDLADLVKVPEELEGPAAVFASVVESYRRYFDHARVVDYVHPRAAMHEVLGGKIYRELVDGPRVMPWEVGQPRLEIIDDHTLELTASIQNTAGDKANVVVLPMVTAAWKPTDATPEFELAAGEKRELKIRYALRDKLNLQTTNPMPSHEPLLRLPLMVSVGELVRIEDLRATLQPAALLWQVETLFNQEKDFRPANLLVNTSNAALNGRWEAEWMGQKLSGDVNLEPGDRAELPLHFKLPESPSGQPFNQKTRIHVAVTTAGKTLRFERNVDLTQNFGLKKPVPLTPGTEDKSPPLPELGDRNPSVTLKADADKDTFFLTFDLRGIDLRDDPASGQSWVLAVNLDARSYGQRLTRGATDPLRVSGKAADGPATVGVILPWAFGNGYAARFDEAHVKAVLSSGSEGIRRITLSLPRSYLYLHEWALGNGNSQLGINATISFWQPPVEGASQGGFTAEGLYNLLHNRYRDDAEGNAVLELTVEPTRRWTVTLY